MPEPEDGEPEGGRQEWPPPGDTEALEPATEPVHPLRASDVTALIAKEVA